MNIPDNRQSLFVEQKRKSSLSVRRALMTTCFVLLGSATFVAAARLFIERWPHQTRRSASPVGSHPSVVAFPALAPPIPQSSKTVAEVARVSTRQRAPLQQTAATPSSASRSAPAADPPPTPATSIETADGDDVPAPAEPYRNGEKATHLTGEALRFALIEDRAITRKANDQALQEKGR